VVWFFYKKGQLVMALLFWFCIAGVAGTALFAWVLVSENKDKRMSSPHS
jgi:hypothetical protein